MSNHPEQYLVIKAFEGQICSCKLKAEALKEKARLGGEASGVWVWNRKGENPCEGQRGCEVK